jgi:hypothetical protein
MAHFAKIDENNIVIQVIALGDDLEKIGSEYLAEHYGGRWIQTSYNNKIRGKFAGISDIYDEKKDVFLPQANLDGHYISADNEEGFEFVLCTPEEYANWRKVNGLDLPSIEAIQA